MCLTLHDSPAKPPAATAGVTETVCVYGECRDSFRELTCTIFTYTC